MSDTAESTEKLNRIIHESRELREKYLRDPHRPGYHFVVPEGVHGPVDPNGNLFWNGRYHMHYIYQHEGKHVWGHVSSVDLVHWRHHVPSLVTGEGDDGIFSGGAFIDQKGVATITYWGLGNPRGICIATSTDPQLDTWQKSPHNPLIVETQSGLHETRDASGQALVYGAADPSQIWFNDGRYYMLTGNLLVLNEFGHKRKKPEYLGDTLYLFVSDDLVKWEYLHEFYKSDRKWTRETEDDMCPDFFELPSGPGGAKGSGKHMILFISHNLGCQYYIGDYANNEFKPQIHERMTWVDNEFFAPESMEDAKGRRIMWSWVFDRREWPRRVASGWSGELSLPRELWLGEDGTLRMRPIEELKTLRYNERSSNGLAIESGKEILLPKISGDSIELEISVKLGQAKRFGVKVCCSPGGEEETTIVIEPESKSISIDTRKSSLNDGVKMVETAPFALRDGEAMSLRIFVDKSFVDVFVNDRQAVCRRIYPSRRDSTGVKLFADGANLTADVKGWDMMPSNPF